MKRLIMLAAALSLVLGVGHALAQAAPNFDDPAEYAKQKAELTATAANPTDPIYLQHIGTDMVDTTKYKKPGPWTLCFSNAAVDNPWRVVGLKNMQAQVAVDKANIKDFIVTDAGGSDDKQIADINDLLTGGKCDVLMIAPNTTAALTPAVEKACAVLPVIVFDRGVTTKCPVSFVHPVGGYGFGIAAADFIAKNVPKGGNVLALRILPGVDVLETRYSAAKHIFADAGLNIVGAEFTGGDNAKTKSVVEDYMQKGKIDAIFMDAGATAVAAIEAFEDAGQPVPVITGEDQQDFLQKWKADKLTAIAPTYPNFHWRTAVIAAEDILAGKPIPGPEWVLPQPSITADTLDKYINVSMPPLHYAMCGCEDFPDYPARWGGK
jgi:ribose transport system substrate-binding protein